MIEDADAELRPLVVVDTTAIWGDWALSGRNWSTILRLAEEGLIRLVVSEVVVTEAVRKWLEKAEALYASAIESGEKRRRHFRGLRNGEPDLPPRAADPEQVGKAEYRSHLLERLKCAEVLPIPEISHHQILRRDMERRRPIPGKWKGLSRHSHLGDHSPGDRGLRRSCPLRHSRRGLC